MLAIYHLTDYLQEDIRRELRSLLVSLLTGIIVTAGLVIFIVDRAVSRPITCIAPMKCFSGSPPCFVTGMRWVFFPTWTTSLRWLQLFHNRFCSSVSCQAQIGQ